MEKKYILAIDEGTTSTRTLLYNIKNNCVDDTVACEFMQHYPASGMVEHDMNEVWDKTLFATRNICKKNNIKFEEIAGVGITNQRETVVVWDKNTGEPICNAIVWQCRRTSEYCNKLIDAGLDDLVKSKTGLKIDAYFSASKIKWILDNVPNARARAERGELLCGTCDTFLVWKMTKGKAFVTDYSNASRTMLFNIRTLEWDNELLDLFGIPLKMLPKVVNSSEVVGNFEIDGVNIPIAGICGDQQSALFGQGCFDEGMAKNTYGTGCFMLMNIGEKVKFSDNLLTTIAWGLNGKVCYALEGSVFNAGSVITWLTEGLGVISNVDEIEILCKSVDNNGGVYFVPAFTGLGAPYWDMDARGMIMGLSRNVTKAHIVRAGMESIAYNTKAIMNEIYKSTYCELKELRADGGVSKNDFLMQFQADLIACKISRQQSSECTALGVVYLAGLAVGVFENILAVKNLIKINKEYYPSMSATKREILYHGWQKAINKTLVNN